MPSVEEQLAANAKAAELEAKAVAKATKAAEAAAAKQGKADWEAKAVEARAAAKEAAKLAKDAEMRVLKEAKAAKAAIDIPCIKATFQGQYYKGGSRGSEAHYYKETISIPEHWVQRTDLTPIGIFKFLYAPRILSKLEGYKSVRTCELVEVSELPSKLNIEQILNWTATHGDLADLVEIHAPEVHPHLHPTGPELRFAIKQYLIDPKAFVIEQAKKAASGFLRERAMEDELTALGY